MFWPKCYNPVFVFFLPPPLGVVCIGETPMGSPYAHMRPPTGVSYQPFGVGKRQLFFSYRTVSLRLPGSYTNPPVGVGSRYVMSTPTGVLIPTPKGWFTLRNEHPYGGAHTNPEGLVHATFNAYTCVRTRVRTILAILVAI